MFVSAFMQIGNGSQISNYLQLLSLPTVAAPALTAVRALVANLQSQGGDQQWIMQSPPTSVAATLEALNTEPSALRLSSGQYIAVPKEQVEALNGKLADFKILDGYLVPKEATALDVYDAAPQTMQQISYVSLGIKVKQAKLSNCAA